MARRRNSISFNTCWPCILMYYYDYYYYYYYYYYYDYYYYYYYYSLCICIAVLCKAALLQSWLPGLQQEPLCS